MTEMEQIQVMCGCIKSIAGTWTQIGSDINGETAGDNSGYIFLYLQMEVL